MTRDQKRNLRAWIKALRSGAYEQGRNVLCREIPSTSRYCCLGVAADVCIDGWWVLRDNEQRPCAWVLITDGGYESAESLPSKTFHDSFGLPASVQAELIQRNDSWGHDFAKIADYLETFLSSGYTHRRKLARPARTG